MSRLSRPTRLPASLARPVPFRFHSVRARVLVAVLLAALPGLVALAVDGQHYVSRLLERIALTQFSNDVLAGCDAMLSRIDAGEREVLTAARLLRQEPRLPASASLAVLAVVDGRGVVRAVERGPRCPPSLRVPARLELPPEVPAPGETEVFPVYLRPPGRVGSLTLALATPLEGPGRRGSFLVGLLDPAVLFQWVNEAQVSGGRETFVLDGAGRPLSYSAPGTPRGPGAALPEHLPLRAPLVNEIRHSAGGLITRPGAPLIAYASIDFDPSGRNAAWVLGMAVPRATALASVAELRRHNALALLATVLVAAVLAMLLAGQITGPLQRLRAGADRIASGDLYHPLAVETSDEVGELARSFQVMTESLRMSLAELETERTSLERRVAERTAALRAQGEQLAAANESLRSLDRMKSDFITNVSHELRTPVTMLSGALQLVDSARETDPAQAAELFQIAQDGLDRLMVLVQKVIEYTDADAGPETWVMGEVDVRALVAEVVADALEDAAQLRVSLVAVHEEGVPYIRGSTEKLATAVRHLVANALQFTPAAGQVIVTTSAGPGGQSARITVEDTGRGIPPEQIPLLFERFEQGGTILTDKPRGMGLGLPIARRIVDHHGGRIEVESKVDVGTAFTIVLPARRRSDRSVPAAPRVLAA